MIEPLERSEIGDGELMRSAAAGEHDAFAILVDRYKDGLLDYLTRMSGSRDRAEDLAQEAFLRLYRSADRYRDEGRLQSYLYTIAGNLLRSEERKRRTWQLVRPRLAEDREEAGDEPAGESRVLLGELCNLLGREISRLPMGLRAPLVLYEVEGWSYREIADHLHCREGTIKSRIHRGRERLRQRLEKSLKRRHR